MTRETSEKVLVFLFGMIVGMVIMIFVVWNRLS